MRRLCPQLVKADISAFPSARQHKPLRLAFCDIVELLERERTQVPTSFLNDPEHCRRRAREARALASQFNDPASEKAMLEIADEYDRLAERAEGQVKRPSSTG